MKLASIAAVFLLVPAAAAQEAPEQFRAWGRKAKAHAYLADPGLEGPHRRLHREAGSGGQIVRD